MQVGMKEEILSPTVEHGEEADLGAEMLGIGSDGGQGLGCGSEQNAVDESFVLVSNGGDRFGQREDEMKIRGRENFRFPLFDPFRPRQRLALGAMSVAAAIVSVTLVRTAVAMLEMTTQGRRPAHLDRSHDASLCRGGLDLQRNRVRQQIEWARRRAHLAGRDAKIFCCGGQAAMSKEQLNGADIGALLE